MSDIRLLLVVVVAAEVIGRVGNADDKPNDDDAKLDDGRAPVIVNAFVEFIDNKYSILCNLLACFFGNSIRRRP